MLYEPKNVPKRRRGELDSSYAVRALESAGTKYFVWVPESSDDVLLLQFPFQWDEHAPKVATLCTSGLLRADQERPRRWCFSRFELALAFHLDGFSRQAIDSLVLFARDLREWLTMPGEIAFGFGDWIREFPLIRGRASGLLVPPVPELLHAGLRPMPRSGTSVSFSGDWLDPDALVAAGPLGFLQVVPLYESEYAHVAASGDGFQFFLDHLLPTAEELDSGMDASSLILDLRRAAANLG